MSPQAGLNSPSTRPCLHCLPSAATRRRQKARINKERLRTYFSRILLPCRRCDSVNTMAAELIAASVVEIVMMTMAVVHMSVRDFFVARYANFRDVQRKTQRHAGERMIAIQ